MKTMKNETRVQDVLRALAGLRQGVYEIAAPVENPERDGRCRLVDWTKAAHVPVGVYTVRVHDHTCWADLPAGWTHLEIVISRIRYADTVYEYDVTMSLRVDAAGAPHSARISPLGSALLVNLKPSSDLGGALAMAGVDAYEALCALVTRNLDLRPAVLAAIEHVRAEHKHEHRTAAATAEAAEAAEKEA
jgi:hypothetical protein